MICTCRLKQADLGPHHSRCAAFRACKSVDVSDAATKAIVDAAARKIARDALLFGDAPLDRDDVEVDDDSPVTHVDGGAAWVTVRIRVDGVK